MNTGQDVPQPAQDARDGEADDGPRPGRRRDREIVVDPEEIAALGRLANVLGSLVETLTGESHPQLTPEEFVALASRCMPSGRHVAVAVAGGGSRLTVLASTDDLSARAAAFEVANGEGPMLDALSITDVAVSNDLAVEAQWPRYGLHVVEVLGLRSALVYRVRRPGHADAALGFLSDWPYAFDELAVTTGSLLALHCSLAAVGRGEVRARVDTSDTGDVEGDREGR